MLIASAFITDRSEKGRLGFILKEDTLEIRLQNQHMATLGLHRAKIPRDGHCLYRAFSQGIFESQSQHQEVRHNVADTLSDNWELFQALLPNADQAQYVQEVKDGAYGGEIEIQAICYAYNIQANIYLGGLVSHIAERSYGNSQNMAVTLVYTADGAYDCGHWDLVVHTVSEVERVEECGYREWRAEKVRLFEREVQSYGPDGYYDHANYGECRVVPTVFKFLLLLSFICIYIYFFFFGNLLFSLTLFQLSERVILSEHIIDRTLYGVC